MNHVNVIGCDPGATGALCLLRYYEDEPSRLHFLDHSATVLEKAEWLKAASTEMYISMAMLEDVHSLPGMSAKSNFTFGGNFREAKTLLELAPFGYDFVQPKVWQKAVGIKAPPEGIKRTSAQLKKEVATQCERLFPGCDIRGPKGGLMDGRSDALMIAYYCLLKHTRYTL